MTDQPFSELNTMEAFSFLHHQQLTLCTWDRWCIAPTEDVMVFGRIPPRWEAELLLNPTDYLQRDHEVSVGVLFGEWFSEQQPDGEWGSNSALGCWPITRILYDEAAAHGWEYDSFPKPLADEFSIRMSQMMDHIEMVKASRG